MIMPWWLPLVALLLEDDPEVEPFRSPAFVIVDETILLVGWSVSDPDIAA